MDFDLTSEQQLLSESAQRFVREQHAFENRAQRNADRDGHRRRMWGKFAELGWLALPFAEDDGGIGCGAIETMLLMQALGRGLVNSAYLMAAIVGGEILRRADQSAHRKPRIAAVIDGSCALAIAHAEPASRYDLARVATTAQRTSPGWTLNGEKCIVLNGEHADQLIVAARTSGAVNEARGITLFLVPGTAIGIVRRGYPLLDGGRGADIAYVEVTVASDAIIGEIDQGLPILEAAVDIGIAALGAEALGIMDALIELTIAHCQTRVQFGQPIGKFQVLQHRMVDMFMETEQTRSLVYLANIRLAEMGAGTSAAKEAISAMKAHIGKAGRFVAQEAIQLHGGMGMTDDLIVGHYFKRLTAIDAMFGNVDLHLKRFAALRAANEM